MDRQHLQRMLDDLPQTLNDAVSAIGTLNEREFSATSAEGEIVATVDAVGQLKNVVVGISAKRNLDNLTLGEEITEAIRQAQEAAAQGQWGMLEGLRIGDLELDKLMADPRKAMQKLFPNVDLKQ